MKKVISIILVIVMLCSTFAGLQITSNATSYQTVSIEGMYYQENARTLLNNVNSFRTGSNAWSWNSNNTQKIWYSCSELTYDYELEQIAMQRSAELAVYYSNTRPNGSFWNTAHTDYNESNGVLIGENIYAVSNCSVDESADEVFSAWLEENEPYMHQNHRRNLLGVNFVSTAFSCFKVNDVYYWVQLFRSVNVNPNETIISQEEVKVDVELCSKFVDNFELITSNNEYEVNVGEETEIALQAKLITTNHLLYYFDASTGTSKPFPTILSVKPNLEIVGDDRVNITNNYVQGKLVGETTLLASAFGKQADILVTVKKGSMPDGWCGDKIHYSFDTETGNLVITGHGEMYECFSFCDELYYPEGESEKIKSAVIEEGITTISNSAFEDCEELEVVVLPQSLEYIGENAFANCKNLCEVSLPANVSTIEYCAFANCTKLTDISIADGIECIAEDAFINTAYYNDSSNWKNGILYIGPALIIAEEELDGNCYIEDGTTCIARSAFLNCATQRVVIPNSVKYICDSAFLGCYSLADITMSENIIGIENGAFDDTAYFENAKNWENNVLYVDNALITSRGEIPKDYLVKKGTTCIAEQAFLYSSGLKSISIPKSVSHIGIWAMGFEITPSGTPRVIRDFVINGIADSCANIYANENEIQFNALSHIHEYDEMFVNPQATSLGYVKHFCSCGNYYIDSYSAPTGKLTLKHSARTANSIKVQWKNVKTASGYQVQISSKDGKKWSTSATLKAGITNYTFKKLTAGNNYKFRVRFYIKTAEGNKYSPWSATLNSPTSPKATTVKATAAKKAFTAKWTKVAGVTGYQVQYSTNAKFSKVTTKNVKGAGKVLLAVKSLKGGTKYYVKVRTYKTIGGKKYFSAWSAAKAVTTKK